MQFNFKYKPLINLLNQTFVYLLLVQTLATISETVLTTLSAKEDIHFEIVEPETLRYTYRARMAQNFGTTFSQIYSNMNLVIVEPNDSCTSLVNTLELFNNIGLIERGGCSFLAKCIVAEMSGMVGVIIYDNNHSNDDLYIEMVTDNTTRNCSIPAAFLLGKDGHMIRRALDAHRLNRAVVNIPVNISQKTVKLRQPPWVVW
ncbi:protease-associated domain-containing protein 1-like [Oppia nitens]|uniref:protease-associated domain-containing protein 1-like n=1 Tax=Oppia nitens TaxID=1686743 RepID=UPI0023D9BADD|nr:protease-associated domain-containing protein 1-like [Oppia nitens]